MSDTEGQRMCNDGDCPDEAFPHPPHDSEGREVWQRCVCDQYGRCLADCPSAGLVRPNPSAYYDRRRGEWVQR